MESSIEDILLEFLEQNKNWWEQAAATCEARPANLPSPDKETELLLAAVYRERAERHMQTIERLPQGRKTAHN